MASIVWYPSSNDVERASGVYDFVKASIGLRTPLAIKKNNIANNIGVKNLPKTSITFDGFNTKIKLTKK